jgi:AbrB family looped-hinge helix DNA binding protein
MTVLTLERGGVLTLPADTRDELRLKEGDRLEAEVVDGILRLKPLPSAEVEEAWRKVREAQASVRYIGPEPRPSPEEEEEWIYEVVSEFRDRRGA